MMEDGLRLNRDTRYRLRLAWLSLFLLGTINSCIAESINNVNTIYSGEDAYIKANLHIEDASLEVDGAVTAATAVFGATDTPVQGYDVVAPSAWFGNLSTGSSLTIDSISASKVFSGTFNGGDYEFPSDLRVDEIIQAATGDFDNLIIGGEPYATPTPQQIPSDIVISITDNVILGANYYQYILPNWDDETSLYYGKMFRSGTPIVRVGEALDSEYTPYVVFLNGAKVGSHRGFKVILADGEYFTVDHRVYMFAFLDDVSADAQTFASLDKDIETQFQFASDPIGIRLGVTHTRRY